MFKLPPPSESESSLYRRRRARSLALREPVPQKKWYVSPVGKEPNPDDPQIPDLLHALRLPWGDLQGVAQLVRFSFEGGECTGVFDAMIEATPMAPSSWNEDAFTSHLFLEDMVHACFTVKVDDEDYPIRCPLVVKLLSRPPSDHADTEVRQHVFRELLDHPSLRADLERAYVAIRRLRDRLEDCPVDEGDTITRKVDVLRSIRDCIDALADGFEGANSRLSHLRHTGEAMRDSEDYVRLLQLIELEGNLATVDLRVRLGADGHVRAVTVMSVKENTGNPLLPSAWERAWQRVLGLVRGHRYGQREVLVALFSEVFRPLVDVVVTCLALTGATEFYLAGLGFGDLAKSKGLATCIPQIVDPPGSGEDRGIERRLEGIFNPLLLLQDLVPVATDLVLARHDELLLLTGPNSGGKTRILQAIALTQCLGQAGLPVPAKSAVLVRAPTMFVSLVDEFDAAQSEGRLGTELVRIRKLFEELQPGAVAILDELCSGTNPAEGEAIAQMVISLLGRLHPQVFVSTHFLGLAERLYRERPFERLAFLEVELDEDNKPTYAFVPGVARTSLAHMVAARLGVTHEELEQIVEEKMTPRREE